MSEFSDNMNMEIQDTRGRDVLLGRPDNEIDTDIGHAKSVSLPTNQIQTNQIQTNQWYKWPTLWSIINMFKGAITKYANQHDIIFARQWRYHDHIIRNEWEYERIKHYIQTNPENRDKDCFAGM
jgi:putative transposase